MIMPNSPEDEVHLLSAIFIAPADVLRLCDKAAIEVDSFFDTNHGIIYDCLRTTFQRLGDTSQDQVFNELKRTKQLKKIGGLAFLTQVSSTQPTQAMAAHYVDRVAELALRRKQLRASQSITEILSDENRDIEDALTHIETLRIGPATSWPVPVSADQLCAHPPTVPNVLIEGMLYRGGTWLVSGPSKAHKSFTMIDAGLAVADGRPWLGFKTTQAPVLYLNLELQDFAMYQRIDRICSAAGATPSRNFHPWNLRGRRVSIAELRKRLPAEIKRIGAGLVVIDPHYKVSVVSGAEENSNDSQGELLTELEGLCGLNGAALAAAHHFAKGNASEKNSIDRASGGGVFARWGDVIMTFTPHQEEGAMSVEMALRNFAPVAPFVVRWNHPRWTRDGELDPANLKRAGAKEKFSEGAALAKLTDKPLTFSEWRDATGMTETTFRRKLKALTDAGQVEFCGGVYRRKAA